jgi:hypothetical protein
MLEDLTTASCVVIISNMKAGLLLRRRVVVAVDAFVEAVVWHVPEPVPPSTHGFKYRLAYVVSGRCVVRYDNERGKGDHRHTETAEEDYEFSTPDQLMVDFEADIARWNHENGRS